MLGVCLIHASFLKILMAYGCVIYKNVDTVKEFLMKRYVFKRHIKKLKAQ